MKKALVMLSDIMPTGLEIGVQYGNVKPGDTIAIIGAGPVGMSVLLTAQFYSPGRIVMIDMDPARLELAKQFGATDTIQVGAEDPVARILEMTGGLGVDVAIEAVGVPATFDICQRSSRRAAISPMWVFTAPPCNCISKSSGSRISISRWGLSAPIPRRCC